MDRKIAALNLLERRRPEMMQDAQKLRRLLLNGRRVPPRLRPMLKNVELLLQAPPQHKLH